MNYENVQSELFNRLKAAAPAIDVINAVVSDSRDDPEIHSKVLASFLSISLEEEEASEILARIAAHHRGLAERLGYDLDPRVAAMDFATRHPELVDDPVVVSAPTLALSQRLAAVDELTGLFNRRFLDIYLSKEMNRARRYRETFSIVFVDVDDFKLINDGYGHDVGDQVLSMLAREILALLRREDFAARYGGEEFLVVLPHTDTDGARHFVERLTGRLDTTDFPHRLHVTYSGGIATFPIHGTGARELVHNADAALYQAKLNGKAHVRVALTDKRALPRHVADLRARCFVDDKDLGEVRLHDISRAGVSVEGETLLATGQTIRFRIVPPGHETAHELEVLAKILWSRKVDELEYRFGGQWASADDELLDSLIDQVVAE